MVDLKRLLISQNRLLESNRLNRLLLLTKKESHYLTRVLRLKKGNKLIVLDGCGKAWEAEIVSAETIFLMSDYENPYLFRKQASPQICLGVVIPKRDFEIVLRMSCEIGVDIIQPLFSERSVIKPGGKNRRVRWKEIIGEAVEQSERLWIPQLNDPVEFKNIFEVIPETSAVAITTPRSENEKFDFWVNQLSFNISAIWTLVGPEGGWSESEISIASDFGYTSVNIGETILRTSTASVVASQLMSSWRCRNTF